MLRKIGVIGFAMLVLAFVALTVLRQPEVDNLVQPESESSGRSAAVAPDDFGSSRVGFLDDSFVSDLRIEMERSMLDRLRDESYGEVSLLPIGPQRLRTMNEAEFEQYKDELMALLGKVRQENWESADRWLEEYRRSWPQQACPSGGASDEAIFDDLLAQAVGLASFADVNGFELNHSADLSLPDGVLHVAEAAFVDARAVDIGALGVHPLFTAATTLDGQNFYVFAQLVVGPGTPVRWVEEERFLFPSEYATLWMSGTDAQVISDFDLDDTIESHAWLTYSEALIAGQEPGCDHWAHVDGRNVVRLDSGWESPAYVGYDAAGGLVAITWDFRDSLPEQDNSTGVTRRTPTPQQLDTDL